MAIAKAVEVRRRRGSGYRDKDLIAVNSQADEEAERILSEGLLASTPAKRDSMTGILFPLEKGMMTIQIHSATISLIRALRTELGATELAKKIADSEDRLLTWWTDRKGRESEIAVPSGLLFSSSSETPTG